VRKRGTKTGGHTSVTQQFEDLFKTKMKFPTVTPDVCAAIAREIFSKETGYSNKTTKALDKEICESLIGTSSFQKQQRKVESGDNFKNEK
jgi:hypothetical protein